MFSGWLTRESREETFLSIEFSCVFLFLFLFSSVLHIIMVRRYSRLRMCVIFIDVECIVCHFQHAFVLFRLEGNWCGGNNWHRRMRWGVCVCLCIYVCGARVKCWLFAFNNHLVVFERQFNCELKESDVKQVGKQLSWLSIRNTFEEKATRVEGLVNTEKFLCLSGKGIPADCGISLNEITSLGSMKI